MSSEATSGGGSAFVALVIPCMMSLLPTPKFISDKKTQTPMQLATTVAGCAWDQGQLRVPKGSVREEEAVSFRDDEGDGGE